MVLLFLDAWQQTTAVFPILEALNRLTLVNASIWVHCIALCVKFSCLGATFEIILVTSLS